MHAAANARIRPAPIDSMASNGPISMVSMDSYSILDTTPNVKIVMATVPANAPSLKISAQTEAMTSVGSVRTMFRMTRSTDTTYLLRLMLVDANTANGSESRLPSAEPMMDIFTVSTSGPTMSRQ